MRAVCLLLLGFFIFTTPRAASACTCDGQPLVLHPSAQAVMPSDGQFILGVSYLSMTEDGGHTFSIRDATLDQEVAVQIQVGSAMQQAALLFVRPVSPLTEGNTYALTYFGRALQQWVAGSPAGEDAPKAPRLDGVRRVALSGGAASGGSCGDVAMLELVEMFRPVNDHASHVVGWAWRNGAERSALPNIAVPTWSIQRSCTAVPWQMCWPFRYVPREPGTSYCVALAELGPGGTIGAPSETQCSDPLEDRSYMTGNRGVAVCQAEDAGVVDPDAGVAEHTNAPPPEPKRNGCSQTDGSWSGLLFLAWWSVRRGRGPHAAGATRP